MAQIIEQKSLNDHIESLCEKFPQFRRFNAKFKGKYIITCINVNTESRKLTVIDVDIVFTDKLMMGAKCTLTVVKYNKNAKGN